MEETRQRLLKASLYYGVYGPSDDAAPNAIVLKHANKSVNCTTLRRLGITTSQAMERRLDHGLHNLLVGKFAVAS